MEYQPVHTFTRPIKYGERSMEVEWLQKCLVHQGLHPANCVTGAFFGITLKSVKAFQEKYEYDILLPLGLSEPTGVVGKATIAKLNQLYGTK
jgi:peptidoglycan hydrolase-like protein with peptidoglycan-binding domain